MDNKDHSQKRDKSIGTRLTAAQHQALQRLAGEKDVGTFLFELVQARLETESRFEAQASMPIPEPLPPPPPPPPPQDRDPGVAVHDIWTPDTRRYVSTRGWTATLRHPFSASKRWPSARPIGVLAAFVVAGLATWGAWHAQMTYRWTAEQRDRWPVYVQSGVYAGLGLPAASYAFLKPGRYDHGTVYDYLRATVYDGRSVFGAWRDPAIVGLVVLAIGMVVGGRRDWRVRELRRVGRVVKGPELVTADRFSRLVRGNGLVIEQRRGPPVAIPRASETMHLSVSGGTGSGKSTLIRQWLRQIADRGETAVVYDPAGEFVGDFYDASRGDVILNPYDARFPGWAIGQEVERDADAMAVAAALFTTRKHGDEFFREVPRRIFAHLLTRTPRPSATQLRDWLGDADLLDAVLTSSAEGRHHAAMVPKSATHQHGGILAELNLVADVLSTLPPEGPESWSAARWSQQRTGWLFVTSDAKTRERQLPLMTLWLDLVLLRVMQRGSVRRTWVVMDELASIGRLPQLPTALAEARKFNVALILGFQSTSQLQAIYGDHWKAMVSAPATHVVLRTMEPESAKWEAALLGEVQRERIKETHTKTGRRWSRSDVVERTTEPLVMASQIGGLAPLEGYVKHENHVVAIAVEYGYAERRVPAFIARHA